MTPREAAATLRQIADKIDASEKPSLARVAADIRTVYNNLVAEGKPAPAQQQR